MATVSATTTPQTVSVGGSHGAVLTNTGGSRVVASWSGNAVEAYPGSGADPRSVVRIPAGVTSFSLVADSGTVAVTVSAIVPDQGLPGTGTVAADDLAWTIEYNVLAFGAVADGIADDTAPIQAAIDAAEAAGGGIVNLGAFAYKTTAQINLPSHVTLRGVNAGGQINGPTRIVYAGSAGGTVIGPKYPATDQVNIGIEGIQIDGGNLAAIVVSFYRISYSRISSCLIMEAAADGVGVLFDANVNNQCYFNTVDHSKVSDAGTGARFQNGANANRWLGGKIGNGGTGMEFLSLSAGNLVEGVDLETNSVQHFNVDAPSNVFIGNHMEVCPLGFNITTNGGSTRRFGNTYASNVTTYVQNASGTGLTLDDESTSLTALRLGGTKVTSNYLSGTTTVNVDPYTYSGTANAILNLFRNVNTSGTKQIVVYKGNDTSTIAALLDPGNGVFSIGTGVNVQGASGAIGLSNRTTAPSAAPVAGGVLYAQAGAMRYVTSGGAFVTVAGDVTSVSANYTALPSDSFILATGGAGGITVTLPAAVKGSRYLIKKVDAGAGAVTVATTSSQTIDGATTKVLSAQYASVTVVSDGAAWYVI